MARIARQNIETRYTHVMMQGIGKEYIFPDEDSKGYYLTCIQKAQKVIDGKILAFCIMGNHAHLLVCMKKPEELGKFMQKTNTLYAKYYNRTKKRVGYVFRDRFKSEGITNSKYLLNCVVYIQNNPVKANIVKNAEDYLYSSYKNYLTGQGVVSFEEAAKHYDISATGMRQVMQDKSGGEWLEHDDREYEDVRDVLLDIVKKYHIASKEDIEKLGIIKEITMEMQDRSGASLREIAKILEVNREYLRKIMSTPPSP